MNKDENLKKDLLDIYKDLKNLLSNETFKHMFSKDLQKKFRYSIDEVNSVLNVERKISIRKDITTKTNNFIYINDINSLREYYKNNLSKIFDAKIDENQKQEILKNITIKELVYLYSIISTLPVPKHKNKKDIIYMLKIYFDDESRTNDINNKLIY